MTGQLDAVAEAIWRAASGGGVWYPPGRKFGDGIPTNDVFRYRLMAQAAIDAIALYGCGDEEERG